VSGQHSYLRLARRLRQSDQPILGLWPVPVSVTLGDLPRHLAKALASLGSTVGLVAPRECWNASVPGGMTTVVSIDDSVDSITPVCSSRTNPVAAIEQMLLAFRERYACMLLNLAGWDDTQVQELALIPGVGIVIFVAQGQINEFALARLRRRVSADRVVGAVLLEPGTRGGLA
jgi:hypothetical protein